VTAAEPSAARRLGRLIPVGGRLQLQQLWCRGEAIHARHCWDEAKATGPLDPARLALFDQRFPIVASTYNYLPNDLLARGLDRHRQLARRLPNGSSTLEVGSADGMTAAMLSQHGHTATAIDIDISRTDSRVPAAGVRVIEMDATRLDFPDASFDLVYSFNVFEHLTDPAAALREMTRVLRPGGTVFVSFTALRWSPFGAHLGKAIGIPYVTVLFDEHDVAEYLQSRKRVTYVPWVNDYSIERFREAFRAQRGSYADWRYNEIRNRWHARLVAEYAPVFKGRAPSFDSLLTESVRLRAKKIQDEGSAPRG
jgi:SAM-dependent methyltransferase